MLSRITLLSCSLFSILLLTAGIANDDGKAGKTGAPGETTCISCHDDFNLGDGGGSITMGVTNMAGWEYVPGTTYNMTATVARTGTQLFGVGIEVLTASGTNAGSLAITNTSTAIKNATVTGVSRRNVVHTLNGGAAPNAKVFEFDWTAPSTNIGNVTFYFSGVAANGDGDAAVGDYVYAGNQVVTPSLGTSIHELAPDVEINVYPNPVTDVVKVDYVLRVAERVVITLFDMNGRVVEQLSAATRRPGRHTEMIGGMDRFSTGTYLLRTQLGDRTVERRVQIQH
jgi:hypothetical protein